MSRIPIHFAGELRRRVLVAATASQLHIGFADMSLHRNSVVAHSSPTKAGMSRHSLRGSLHFIPQNELRGLYV